MKIKVERIYTCTKYTIGRFYVNGKYICDTIEDADRGLSSTMTVEHIKSLKIYGKTAIPYGTYDITMNVKSPKFSVKPFYQRVCNGFVPRLIDVKGFEGVLIHTGNTADDSFGCILVGDNTERGKVTKSKDMFEKIMNEYLLPAKKRNEKITIQVTEVYKRK